MQNVVDVIFFALFIVTIEFTSVCFEIELSQFRVIKKYGSLEGLPESCSLVCSAGSARSESAFPVLIALDCL
jgi:hypothetical protein